MIKINVIINNVSWSRLIKNPSNYIDRKVKKLNLTTMMLLDIHQYLKLLGLIKLIALMIKINVITNNVHWLRYIKNPNRYIDRKVNKLNLKNKNFKKNIFFCTLLLSDSKEIKRLNKKFRKKSNSTDVLSFPFHNKKNLKNKMKREKEIYLGDIIVNLNKISDKKKIKNFKLEFNKLWIHGLIHLFGFDHKREKDYIKMQKIESNYLSYIQ